MLFRRLALATAVSLALAGSALVAGGQAAPTAADARVFLDEVNEAMLRLAVDSNRAGWVQATHITHDTNILAAKANEAYSTAVTKYATDAARFDKVDLPGELRRQMDVLKLSLTLAAPSDPKEAAEVTQLGASMEAAYGQGKYCPEGGQECLDILAIEKVMQESRESERLREVWQGWHKVGAPLKKDYARFAELSNKGARQLGFADTGAMWRSQYDMPPDAFAKELDRLWEQLRPLYVSLHAYVRWKLREKYGALVPPDGPMPAHLLGNLWAQDWSYVYDLVAPTGADPGYSLTEILKSRKTEPMEMVRYGERFFTSLGFEPLPKTFWERSLFTKPRDREVVCHASAWDIDAVDDLRIKMCININEEDFATIHHELGHNFYQRAYNKLPPILRGSANDGFHEALGDVLALSVTPEYLSKIGLLKIVPDPSKDVGLLLQRALERLAFLPFGLVVDGWRWQVFAGKAPPDTYNKAWWDLKLKYQGVAPPAPRDESFFDPGAKYHVPANTPYARYFLAHVLEFQFHRALAKAAGCSAPLHRCSIYGSKEAGRRLKTMMEMGQSRPWPEALEIVTGQREMDATAMAEYFAPLKRWLDEQNQGKPVGW
jgi:peptidyl-dipeptidase A